METRREKMAAIISCVTGLREKDLETYGPLKNLLKKANRPGKQVIIYDFGLLRFRWPQGFTEDGESILDIRLFETGNLTDLRRLENRMWRGRIMPDIMLASLVHMPINASKK